jgi:hypothetical protein
MADDARNAERPVKPSHDADHGGKTELRAGSERDVFKRTN